MKKICTWCTYIILLSGLWFVIRAQRPSAPAAEAAASARMPAQSLREKHKVTSAMLSAAEKVEGHVGIPFQAADANGELHSLHELATSSPLVLVFIKDGCPCSSAAQPYLNRLYEQYGSVCRFAGVIDVDAAKAKEWGDTNHVRFPILEDSNLAIVHRYEVSNSAYIALIAPGGHIEKMWPGYSADMLHELGHRIAQMTRQPEQIVFASGAPNELYSGCPY
jgi:peroxiredoxin